MQDSRLRDVLVGYALTIFGVFFALNFNTTFSSFGWFYGGGLSFFDLIWRRELDVVDQLAFWYAISGVLYIVLQLLIVAVFLRVYLNKPLPDRVRSSTKAIFLELVLLSGFGLSPVVALHTVRMFLTYVPQVDPVLPQQIAWMRELGLDPDKWTFRATPISTQASLLGVYSAFILVSAGTLAFLVDRLTGTRFFPRTRLRAGLARVPLSIKKFIRRHFRAPAVIQRLWKLASGVLEEARRKVKRAFKAFTWYGG